MSFWNDLKKPIVGLAPMDGITDEPMRWIQTKIAKPDVCFTEFVNVEYVLYRPDKILRNFTYSDIERPIVAQLSGHTPELFYKLAIVVCSLGFDGVDINMGCPVTSVTHRGGGAMLVGNYDLSEKIVLAVEKAVKDWVKGTQIKDLFEDNVGSEINNINNVNSRLSGMHPRIDTSVRKRIPISIKTRIGIDKPITKEWITFLVKLPVEEISLHGRTLKQGYSGLADWEEISLGAGIAKKGGKILLGNGDIKSENQGIEYSLRYQTDGVLIARAALGNPWVFSDHFPTPKERLETMLLHAKRFHDIFGDDRFLAMRKHFGWYPKGFSGARELKTRLLRINDLREVQEILGKSI